MEAKRLFKSRHGRVFAGVASGIAAYFNIDPIIVRVIFVASVIYGGLGVLIYLILWILLPEE